MQSSLREEAAISTPIRTTKTLTVTDPREFDGDPYQVAERAIRQQRALLSLILEDMDAVDIMLRNAELERQLAESGSAETLRQAAALWPQSPQGRRIEAVRERLEEANTMLASLQGAAAFDPKAKIR